MEELEDPEDGKIWRWEIRKNRRAIQLMTW